MKYELHTRSQHSRGSSIGRFGGPDTYVAVTIALNEAIVPYVLNRAILAKRGIEIKYFGEGYSQHTGPKSMLAQAIADAKKFIETSEQPK